MRFFLVLLAIHVCLADINVRSKHLTLGTDNGQARFTGGVVISRQDIKANSHSATVYFTDKYRVKSIEVDGEVLFTSPKYRMTCHSARYNKDTSEMWVSAGPVDPIRILGPDARARISGRAHVGKSAAQIIGEIILISGEIKLKSQGATAVLDNGVVRSVHFPNKTVVLCRGALIHSDTADYSAAQNKFFMRGNVVVFDKKATVYGDVLEVDVKSKQYSLISVSGGVINAR